MWPFTKRSKGEVALKGMPVHVNVSPRGRQAVRRNAARVARLKLALQDATSDERAQALEAEIKRREG